MRYEKCAICKIKKGEGNVSFFKVPKYEVKRCRWNESCAMFFKINDFVCEKHFLPSDFIERPGDPTKRPRLQPGAAPSKVTLIPFAAEAVSSAAHEADEILPMEEMLEEVGYCGLAESILSDSVPQLSQTEEILDEQMLPMQESIEVLHKDCCTQTDNVAIESGSFLEVIYLNKKIKKLEVELASFKNEMEKRKRMDESLRSFLTEGQIRKLHNPVSKQKWSWEDISNAICLHASGPRAYRHLYAQGCPLPHESSLQRWARKVEIEEGILRFCLDSMKFDKSLSEDEKICVLSFDEMKVCAAYEYDPSGDLVREPSNYVQVAMARGLKKSWKQPVFYAFDCKMTKNIVIELIMALYNASYTVVGMVSDMGPTNQTLWRELGVSAEKPWFQSPINADDKVFIFADAPHLLKLVRNHFLDSGFLWNDVIITPKTIKEVIDNVSKSDVSIAYKLTDEHLSVRNAGRQKVKLAAQLFSNSTANAIKRCFALGRELYQPLETADFIQLMNDWFDVLNSKLATMNYPGKKPYGKDLSYQNEVLSKMDSFMANPIMPTKKSLAPFQKGILMTNNALRQIYEYVKTRYGMDYILTYRLNQDVIENFFGAIRSKGGLNDHPSPRDFKFRMRKYVLGIRVDQYGFNLFSLL